MDKHKRPQQYAYLEQLSLEELKGIVRKDSEQQEENDSDFILAVLEVIQEKECALPDYRPVDLDSAWAEFQDYCASRQRSSVAPPPARANVQAPVPWPIRKWRIIVTAVTAIFVLMLTAQAVGVDILGAAAQWTDEIFHFTWAAAETPEPAEWVQTLIEQVGDAGLIPTWIPDGYEAGELVVERFNTMVEYFQPFTDADGRYFDIRIVTYSNPEYIPQSTYEKDASSVEIYHTNGVEIYLFTNMESNTGICLDSLTEISLTGDLTTEELKQIFDSIGGISHET